MKVYENVIDKSAWGDGPWQEEPDKVQWTDEATNLPCLAVRSHYGNWCGYVGVSRGHPAFEREYDQVDVEVHGGLTYAEHCDVDAPEESGICHVPEPGEPDDVWWLGFDCGHAGDVAPMMEAHYRKLAEEDVAKGGTGWPWTALESDSPFPVTYKTLGYVKEEIASLASQLKSKELRIVSVERVDDE